MFRNNQSSLPCKFIVFEGDFILIPLVFVVEISNSCVSGVTIEKINHLSFDVLVLIKLKESCIFIMQIIFSHILVSLKKRTSSAIQCNTYLEEIWIFLTNGDFKMRRGFYWFSNGRTGFEANHEGTRKCNSVRVLH